MDTNTDSPNRREFFKGLAVGVGGYALGASLIHPEQAMGQSIEGNLEKVPMRVADLLSRRPADRLRP
jgi:hypothetical protein